MNITLDSIIPQNLTAIIYVPDYRNTDKAIFSRSSLNIVHYDRPYKLITFVDEIWDYIKISPFKEYIQPQVIILFNGNHTYGVWQEDEANPESSLTYEQVEELENINVCIHDLIIKTLQERDAVLKEKQRAQKLAAEKAKQEEAAIAERKEYERLKKKFDSPNTSATL